jgi:hypothetical protein
MEAGGAAVVHLVRGIVGWRKGPNEWFLRKSLVRIGSEPSFMRHDLIKNTTRRPEVEHEQKILYMWLLGFEPRSPRPQRRFSPLNYSHFPVHAIIVILIH